MMDATSPYVRDGMDLRLVAKRQRMAIWLVLCSLLATAIMCLGIPFLPRAIGGIAAAFFPLTIFVMVALQLLIVVGTVLLMVSLRTHWLLLIICGLLCLHPFICFLVLIFSNSRAVKALRKAGLHVGLMGVKDEEVVRRLSPNLCRTCGYNLTGNVSGICPECGTAIHDGAVLTARPLHSAPPL